MDKPLDFNAVLKDFRYKPNVGFYAYQHEDEWRIRIVMYVENARGHWQQWELEPYPQDEDRYYSSWDLGRLPPPRTGAGWSPSREVMELQGNFVIPPMFYEGDDLLFVEWMVQQIKGMENHESDEWLMYKGVLINDPHKVVASG